MVEVQARAPRYDLSFPLQLTTDEDGELVGHCLNLSQSGLLANFDQSPELWSQGDLVLHFGEDLCHVQARVARVNGREAGLAFLFRSEADREAIRIMLAFAAVQTQLVGKVPF